MPDRIVRLPPVRYDSPPMDALSLTESYNWGMQDLKIPDVTWAKHDGEGWLFVYGDTGRCRHRDVKQPPVFSENYVGGSDADRNGHGTHVCGLAVGTRNDFGFAGVAPEADWACGKVLGDSGSGSLTGITRFVNRVTERWTSGLDRQYQGCVGNLSIGGGGGSDPAMERAFQDAAAAGILWVASMGNAGGGPSQERGEYPGNSAHTIGSVAYRMDGNRADFSSASRFADCSAPGEAITSTYLNDTFRKMSGTSMSAPFCAGFLILVLATHPHDLNLRRPEGMREFLGDHANDVGAPGKDTLYGFGKITDDMVRQPDFWFF